MSRSHLYHNITPVAGNRSEKFDKRICNKTIRRVSKVILKIYDPDEILKSYFPKKNEAWNHYNFIKDGHFFLVSKDRMFADEGWEYYDKNKYYGHYVTKNGLIRK